MHGDDDKRMEILRVSGKLFAQFGLRKTSVEEIARESRVAKGTIYKFFPSKDEIFKEVVREESASLVRQIREAVSSTGTARSRMRAFLLTKNTSIRAVVNFYRVTRETVSELWPHVDGERERYFTEEEKIIAAILSDGVAAGEIAVTDVELVSHAIVTALKGFELKWILERGSKDLEQTIDTLLDILFRGIVPRGVHA
ncbi:MAG: TetR/AcrR family transcriptional regulator [Candidatus Eisenbacteria sp.]|nr:TetR/AcrR family transcriptional regulator [Candidatus Eisenbacteria bacterium]